MGAEMRWTQRSPDYPAGTHLALHSEVHDSDGWRIKCACGLQITTTKDPIGEEALDVWFWRCAFKRIESHNYAISAATIVELASVTDIK